ncbi:MOSC domain-containing protein [Natronolimnohabitans innermongolicus]|uniref:MOSC domain-containing protein n=1 Tax=Natronolimnohabitans innermongolicus JCM 12255 TaxID=1227499 RepID=L9X1R6_9EURY|nr:MOSC N-terminal beta barrel domain-containing protein [Natronolimnohabitans innermongolicus]ELY55537.1 MOSC domain-containing protein [Natronolimnohabitans innermongolicus JCM 12255]
MARLERLTVYPVKGLDGIDLEATTVLEGGTLAHDREFALFDTDGEVINGKRTERVHDLRTDFDPETTELAVSVAGDAAGTDEEGTATATGVTVDTDAQFDLGDAADRERAADWFGDYFGEELTLERDRTLGYVDRREMGPSVISTATLEAVADWFDDLTVESVRRRMRANVEVDGVEPFWEDRFVGDDAPAFEIDGVRLEGVTPCGRCVVPTRDPETGEPDSEFRRRFVEKREETFPDWADEGAFDHYYTLMLIARVPAEDRGTSLEVGDPVRVLDGD